MKVGFYKTWNTMSHKYNTGTTKYFNILPKLEIDYDSMGFYTFGADDNEYCKQLSITFSFLMLSFCIMFWWDFYLLKIS